MPCFRHVASALQGTVLFQNEFSKEYFGDMLGAALAAQQTGRPGLTGGGRGSSGPGRSQARLSTLQQRPSAELTAQRSSSSRSSALSLGSSQPGMQLLMALFGLQEKADREEEEEEDGRGDEGEDEGELRSTGKGGCADSSDLNYHRLLLEMLGASLPLLPAANQAPAAVGAGPQLPGQLAWSCEATLTSALRTALCRCGVEGWPHMDPHDEGLLVPHPGSGSLLGSASEAARHSQQALQQLLCPLQRCATTCVPALQWLCGGCNESMPSSAGAADPRGSPAAALPWPAPPKPAHLQHRERRGCVPGALHPASAAHRGRRQLAQLWAAGWAAGCGCGRGSSAWPHVLQQPHGQRVPRGGAAGG